MTNEQLVIRIQAGEDVAENMLLLWEQNRGYIATVARRYHGCAETDDLMQEGYLGLCEAVRHYETDRGASFICYADFWIRQVMQRYIENCGNVIRISAHRQHKALKYKRFVSEYRKYYGTEPTDRETAAFLGVGRKELESIKEAAQMGQVRSLSEPVGSEYEDITLGDSIASDEDVEGDVIRAADHEAMSRDLWQAIDQLPEKQSGIIRGRYADGLTVEEAGAMVGLKPTAAWNQRLKAFRTLRLTGREKIYGRYFEEYLSAAGFRHVGIERFRQTWTSETEREAIKNYEKSRRIPRPHSRTCPAEVQTER